MQSKVKTNVGMYRQKISKVMGSFEEYTNDILEMDDDIGTALMLN